MKITVCARIKPVQTSVIQNGVDQKLKSFDHVFNANVTTPNIFTILNKPTDTCYISYGHTNSGKSYTINGLLTVQGSYLKFPATLSCIEIYNNDIYDILANKTKLRTYSIRKHVTLMHNAEFLQYKALIKGKRSTKSTDQNSASSRSHMICTLSNDNQTVTFIDLAGAEDNTNAESYHINLSLYCLRECIHALRNKKSIIPYRRSKLTMCLQEHLTTNLVCICNIDHTQERQSISTLDYGISLKGVKLRINPRISEEIKQFDKHNTRMHRLENSMMNDYLVTNDTKILLSLRNMLSHHHAIISDVLRTI